jgi:heme/copper-type cytochrome/quinol oxidase subunit 1
VRSWHPNRAQRAVLVVALGVALAVVGWWITAGSSFTGWTAYAPLTRGPLGVTGLHLWVRAVIWLLLIGVWTITSLVVLRPRGASDDGDRSSHHA